MTLPINTRYLTIRLQVDGQNFGGSAGTSNVKYITANSGVGTDGNSYLSVEAIIQKSVGFLFDTATIIIRGMSSEDINTFTRTNLTGNAALYSGNQVTIYAGYQLGSDGLPPLVYQGFVLRSGPDYNIARDRPFIMTTMQNYAYQNIIAPPVNYKGVISLDNLFKSIANNSGYYYQSTGVNGNSTNPIYIGDFRTQMQQATQQYGYYYKTINNSTNGDTVYVALKGQPLIINDFVMSFTTGMVGYPIIEDYGASVKCYFNPSLQIGQSLTVQSETVDYVNNQNWYINQIQTTLQNKDENWFSTLQLNTYRLAKGNS